MSDVFFVCVREDVALAEALAEMFDAAGFSVGSMPENSELAQSGAGILIWSRASCDRPSFLATAQLVLNSGKALFVNTGAPLPRVIEETPNFDLSQWKGETQDAALDPLFFAVDQMVAQARDEALTSELSASGLDAGWTAPLPKGRIKPEARVVPLIAAS